MSLIGDLYNNSTLRNSLVAAADQAMASASSVLDSKNLLAARYSASLQQALKGAGISPVQPVPPTLDTPDDAVKWVDQNVAEAQRADVLKRFSVLAVAASREAIQSSYEEANTLASLAAKSGFRVMDFQWPWQRPWTWGGLIGVLSDRGPAQPGGSVLVQYPEIAHQPASHDCGQRGPEGVRIHIIRPDADKQSQIRTAAPSNLPQSQRDAVGTPRACFVNMWLSDGS